MCIDPSYIWQYAGPQQRFSTSDAFAADSPTGKKTAKSSVNTGWVKLPVPCKLCWRCKQNRVNDYVGRALCEASTSSSVCTITLTYRDQEDLSHLVLTKRHFQNFIKQLRNGGHKIRYLAAGEYGERKGRAHFHAILFFQDQDADDIAKLQSEIPHKRDCHIPEWPHGHVHADWTGEDRAIRYVCKYLLAPEKGKGWFSISKKPALGWQFFQNRAQTYIDAGVMPRGWEYLPPGGQQNRPYLLTGASRRDFLLAILQGMVDQIRDESTQSEWVRKAVKKVMLWQHMRNVPQQDTDEFMTALKTQIDRSRLSESDADAISRAYHRPATLWEEYRLQEWRKKQGWFTDEQEEQTRPQGNCENDDDPSTLWR